MESNPTEEPQDDWDNDQGILFSPITTPQSSEIVLGMNMRLPI